MNTILALAAAMAVGLLFTRGAKKLRLPNVTAYLVAGLAVGPYCLGLLKGDVLASMDEITAVALGFIAFSIGNEFKIDSIKRLGKKALIITFFQAISATVMVDVVLILFGFDVPLAITLGAIATATAPAATLMVVRQYHASGELSSTLLSVVAMDDAIGLAVFAISMAISKALANGAVPTVTNMLLEPLLEIALSLAIGFAIGCVVALGFKFFHSRANKLMIMIASVFLGTALADLLNLSSLLLCMSISAAMVNFRSDSDTLIDQVDRWTPPLFMLFFVISGAELDLNVLSTVGLLGVLYIAARAIGKYGGAFLGGKLVKADKNITNYLGLALLPQAGVAIGMAQIVITALPKYGEQIQAVVLCATLIYELIGPVLTRIALFKSGEVPEDMLPKNKQKKLGRPEPAKKADS